MLVSSSETPIYRGEIGRWAQDFCAAMGDLGESRRGMGRATYGLANWKRGFGK